jgi:hypothetical protein
MIRVTNSCFLTFSGSSKFIFIKYVPDRSLDAFHCTAHAPLFNLLCYYPHKLCFLSNIIDAIMGKPFSLISSGFMLQTER